MTDLFDPDLSTDELFARRDEPGCRERLIEAYMPLARSLAMRYAHTGQSRDDLFQVACTSLIGAVDRFDPTRGYQFQSFAVPTILGELKRHHRDRGWSVRVPRRLQEAGLVVKGAVPFLCQELGRSPTVSEIAQSTGLTTEDVLEAMEAQQSYASLSIDVPQNEDGFSAITERLAADDEGIESAERWADLAPLLRQLSPRDREIVALRFFAEKTQAEIAETVGLSQMHVSRLLRSAVDSLRDELATAGTS